MPNLLGIDIGTSGCKAILIDESGRLLAQASAEYPVSMPKPTWSEQNPEDWWQGVQACLRELGGGFWNEGGGSLEDGSDSGFLAQLKKLAKFPEGHSELVAQMRDLERRRDDYVRTMTGVEPEQPTTDTQQPTTFGAFGLTGQMHGAVFLDGEGQVIRPAILWNDQRTAEECAEIDRVVGADVVRWVTCNPPLTGFQLPKLLWLRKHEPENFARVRTVLLPKDYIRFKLTGVLATDVSDASGTGLFDVRGRRWSQVVAEKLGINLGLFPACFESSAVVGRVVLRGFQEAPQEVAAREVVSESNKDRRRISLETGGTLAGDLLGSESAARVGARNIAQRADATSGISVVAGAGDQAAGAVGTGTVKPGIISVSLGTSGVVFACLDEPKCDADGALHTFCHANGAWHAMGVMLSCGGALSWYRRVMRPALSFAEIDTEAQGAVAGCDGLTFLPYLSGERSPHNDPNARGAWVGLTLSHGAAEMSRSVIEGVTFGLRDSLERLKMLGVHCEEIRVTGGGAKSRFWVQIIADVFQARCCTLEADEGPAFGASLLAGIGMGLWKDVAEACDATVKVREVFEPSGVDYGEAYGRFRGLYPALRNVEP